MESKSFKDSIILGSLLEYNIDNIQLRKRQIEDGITIHTCNDYGDSLEIIKDASEKAGKAPKIISKVYYKYPNFRHRRFRPIIDQIKEIKLRLGFSPNSWKLQLCCYCNPLVFTKECGKSFINTIRNDFNIDAIYFENYPHYNLNYDILYSLNKFYNQRFSFGVLGYQNLERRVFSNKDLSNCKNKNINLGFMGFLGLGSKDKKIAKNNNLGIQISNDEKAIINTAYLINSIKFEVASFGITAVSSNQQYDLLKKNFNTLNTMEYNPYIASLIEHLIVLDHFSFKEYDQYLIRYSTIKPFTKRIAFGLLNALMHSRFNDKIGNGFI